MADDYGKLATAEQRIRELSNHVERLERDLAKEQMENVELRSALKTVRDVAIGRVGK